MLKVVPRTCFHFWSTVPVFVLWAKAFVGDLHFYYSIPTKFSTMSDSELACVYSALILHDADIKITVSALGLTEHSFITRLFNHHGKLISFSNDSLFPFSPPPPPPPPLPPPPPPPPPPLQYQADKMTTLIKASGVEVEPIWTTLFSRALEGIVQISNVVSE